MRGKRRNRMTLNERAYSWIRKNVPMRVRVFPYLHWCRWAWLAGYQAGRYDTKRAAQRDANALRATEKVLRQEVEDQTARAEAAEATVRRLQEAYLPGNWERLAEIIAERDQ